VKTCRICRKADYEDNSAMVRVGVRHNAHWKCKLERLPDINARKEWIQSLPKHQLVTIPFLLLESHGLYGFVSKWVREMEREENMKALAKDKTCKCVEYICRHVPFHNEYRAIVKAERAAESKL